MAKKLFAFTLITVSSVFIITMFNGDAHDSYPIDDLLPSSEYADVHGQVFGGFGRHDTDLKKS